MTLKRSVLLLYLVFWANLIAANMALAAVNIETAVEGTIDFNARDATLDEIFSAIKKNLKIEVKGIEDLAGKKISFSYSADTTEDLLKSLLRHLGIKNYAFEFADATLRRLVVVPEAVNAASTPTRSPGGIDDQDRFASVARIQSVVEGRLILLESLRRCFESGQHRRTGLDRQHPVLI